MPGRPAVRNTFLRRVDEFLNPRRPLSWRLRFQRWRSMRAIRARLRGSRRVRLARWAARMLLRAANVLGRVHNTLNGLAQRLIRGTVNRAQWRANMHQHPRRTKRARQRQLVLAVARRRKASKLASKARVTNAHRQRPHTRRSA